MPRRDTTTRSALAAIAASVGVIALVGAVVPSIAHAHTDVEYTVPAADETVPGPVGFITVAFADAVTLVGDGFEVFTPDQQIVRPFVFTEDNAVFQLQLEPPLAGGDVGVRYEVTAEDGHILEGSFAFTVLAAPVTSAPAASASASEPATADTGSAEPSLVVATLPVPTDAETDGDSGGSSTALVIGIVAAVVLAAGAVVWSRSRRSGDEGT